MIGVWDYTVILTYCSIVSACAGILVSLEDTGHPYIGMLFLMICGLCDTFDGRVARSKKNRTDIGKAFGVQIDSLSDLVAFGVLPVCIGVAYYRADIHVLLPNQEVQGILTKLPVGIIVAFSAIFVLFALIRLAWFNVTVEETQGEGVKEKYYVGLPVTSTALIFPSFLIIDYILRYTTRVNISFVYYIILIVVAILFVMKFKLKKPGSAIIYLMVGFGAIEFFIIIGMKILEYYGII